MIFTTQAEAESALAEWQEILLLRDWDIKIDICRTRDMTFDGAAEVHYKKGKKLAIIHILDPLDYENKYWEQDHETSLVHELLHLHTCLFVSDEDVHEERAVDAISRALVRLKRGF